MIQVGSVGSLSTLCVVVPKNALSLSKHVLWHPKHSCGSSAGRLLDSPSTSCHKHHLCISQHTPALPITARGRPKSATCLSRLKIPAVYMHVILISFRFGFLLVLSCLSASRRSMQQRRLVVTHAAALPQFI